MRCPYCKSEELKVTDIRESSDYSNRRRRECISCSKRFTTYERIEYVPLKVIKKGGMRETFERQKIFSGISRACEKRPIEHDLMERVCDEIEAEVRQIDNAEIESKVIGELVMRKLKDLDRIAYIRFASVYRSFTDITQFEKELEKLRGVEKND